jgi:hypothetical protein
VGSFIHRDKVGTLGPKSFSRRASASQEAMRSGQRGARKANAALAALALNLMAGYAGDKPKARRGRGRRRPAYPVTVALLVTVAGILLSRPCCVSGLLSTMTDLISFQVP